jgi:hypothetical protein
MPVISSRLAKKVFTDFWVPVRRSYVPPAPSKFAGSQTSLLW